ncbi:hypothetical protein [Desulfolucanica intricata]|uniref:hypothetical protein n=1 Tax=Desulfolucanica intricata TaxID=1285191 RepID=UPI0008342C42|nr:hypothetical protein [Desulfolucanica intricata]
MNQIYGYGKTILCKQPVIGKWYDSIECIVCRNNKVLTTGISESEINTIVSSKEFCINCPCNQGNVSIYWEMA